MDSTCQPYIESATTLSDMYVRTTKIVIERTRDLIYLKFVAKDFFLNIISSSAGENAGDSVYPLLFYSFCLVD